MPAAPATTEPDIEPVVKRPRLEVPPEDHQVGLAAVRALPRLAGCGPVGTTSAAGALLLKQGMRALRLREGRDKETLVLGGVCSEVFTGPRLAKVLRPAVEYQTRAVEALAADNPSSPLSVHTSVGVPAPVGAFVEALSKHLPWSADEDDWFVNLQVEGTTAVWAGVEILMQLRITEGRPRPHVAVGENSEHGTTGLGHPARSRWPGAPWQPGQVAYPMPAHGAEEQDFLERFDAFLEQHGGEVGVLLVEPHSGSSRAGLPWPKALLQAVVSRCHAKGILILCDEIMCGLGRHGQGTLFLSKAWRLDPDAVTFGESVAAGVFPLSGVLVRRGAASSRQAGAKVVQCHTYAGSSAMALLTARKVLDEVSSWFRHAAKMGQVFAEVLAPLDDGAFLRVQGLGLLWGALFADADPGRRQQAAELLCAACEEEGVWPYFVPAPGFVASPPLDVSEAELREALARLVRCLTRVRGQMAV